MSRRRRAAAFAEVVPPERVHPICWLCWRPLGRKVEWHHPRPKSRGGRETVPVHPICHRTLHAVFSNRELADTPDRDVLVARPELDAFLRWIGNKPPDFHAPTRRQRRDDRA